MTKPTLKEEIKLWKQGYKIVIGIDEAGRGPLAGPVVAGAVCLNYNFKITDLLSEINDSKKLSPQKREELYKIITKNKNIKWGIGIVSEKIIDNINILQATKLAMIEAIKKLKIKPDAIILDGNMKLNVKVYQKSIINGDAKVFSIATASILAKVTRDRIMQKMHKKYPKYGFDIHKGYPTKRHIEAIQKHGICKIHRKSFGPVRDLAKA
jgi:ribonuclease HII